MSYPTIDMKLTTETKIIGGIVLATLLIIIGGAFFFARQSNPNVPKEQIVSENGLHWHPKITITVDGKKQQLPPDIGLSGAIHGEIHTHEADIKDSVVHLEMSGLVTKNQTTIGKFFQAWGKDFNDLGQNVKMRVNGKENKEFESYLMKDKDIIEIIYE